ncbi:hypothetical protein AC578_6544 [Pseudocercospora eumusae]|uniref:Uncharacterized protein n=1 Tax=Pseudocercospora eumusae TaxID=321146 RepID=A0A139HHS3_9PEZI|nr:hypothetical protein AC578_6544 [Pseudocercospora eumusae]
MVLVEASRCWRWQIFPSWKLIFMFPLTVVVLLAILSFFHNATIGAGAGEEASFGDAFGQWTESHGAERTGTSAGLAKNIHDHGSQLVRRASMNNFLRFAFAGQPLATHFQTLSWKLVEIRNDSAFGQSCVALAGLQSRK